MLNIDMKLMSHRQHYQFSKHRIAIMVFGLAQTRNNGSLINVLFLFSTWVQHSATRWVPKDTYKCAWHTTYTANTLLQRLSIRE